MEPGIAFRDLCVWSSSPNKVLLDGVTGFAPKGGITAILGPSAAGKSVLLQAISGRIQDLHISGEVTMNGAVVNPRSRSNPIAYVPQDDSLIGEFTAREVTRLTAVLKKSEEDAASIDAEVEALLQKLGLAHVADGIIGTLIFRGLSGGQKKRVEISSELIASPSILLMDEPTSGLDSSVAYDVLEAVRTIVRTSKEDLSVMLSIHQPNSRILGLFDNIMLLDRGKCIFFGMLSEATTYFSRIGFKCPPSVTPTDYFLQISDSNFKYTENFNFHDAYAASPEFIKLQSFLDEQKDALLPKKVSHKSASLWSQFAILVHREFALAYRDPTLYYFQVALMLAFGFITGAVFFQLPQGVDANFNIFPGGLLWLSLMNGWAHCFKVYHLSKTDKRTKHEYANNKYNLYVWCLADIFTTAVLNVVFFPVAAIAYFMMNLPKDGFPFLILNYWVTCLASEAMLNFITKFSTNPTTSMIAAQIALVNLMVFGGGVFLPWPDCPDYWIWLQESTVFTQSSRAAIMEVYNHLQLVCKLNGGTECVQPSTGNVFRCATAIVDDKCYVDAREILQVTQKIGVADSFWYYFGYLCAIYFGFRVCVVALTVYPWEHIRYQLNSLIISADQNKNRAYSIVKKDKPAVSDLEKHQSMHYDDKAGASLTWQSLSVTLPNGKVLVDKISGYVSAGRSQSLSSLHFTR